MPPVKGQRSVEEFSRAIVLLVRAIRAEAPVAMNNLSWTQRSVVARLEADGPMSSAALARAEGIKPQSMGTALSSLEEQGFIAREAHPTDGRQLLVTLTDKGKDIRKTTRDAKAGWMYVAFSGLTRDERDVLYKAGKIIRRMVETSQRLRTSANSGASYSAEP